VGLRGPCASRQCLWEPAPVGGEAAVAEAGKPPQRRLLIRPKEAVQWALYYPPLIDLRRYVAITGPENEALQSAIALFQANDIPAALTRLNSVSARSRDARYFVLRAALLLSVGRVDQALPDIDRALASDAKEGSAYALRAIIAIVRNENDKALKLAQKASALAPQSSIPQIALSYAYQVLFDMHKALEHAKKAVDLNPQDALGWARLAELQLSVAELDSALAATRKAAQLDPSLERTQSVLGYAHLVQVDIDAARAAFEKAIELDSSAPLAYLGLGLAQIRDGKLDAGTRQSEVAAVLDPENSLIRSYLGKAYYEQKRIKLAATEYARAKALDPKDPTPWFYDAILKQTTNRPVEALGDLQKAIVLNDNSAVYRSRLLLDQDQAARSAALGRIYKDLGFEQRALLEAWRSANVDPGNYSAHRLLADSYSALRRHEIARVSELLQSQLLQPLNITPIQPRLAESDLFLLEGSGPAELAFNEFNPLFTRNRFALQASGAFGSNSTLGDEIVQSGLWNRFSYSLGQFHFETVCF
jgi:tetratricopeptide (TPR) repeat protein